MLLLSILLLSSPSALVGQTAPSTAPATAPAGEEPATLQKLLAEAKQVLVEERVRLTRNNPPLDPKPLNEVIEAELREGFLLARPLVGQPGGQRLQPLTDRPEVVASLHVRRAGREPDEFPAFTLIVRSAGRTSAATDRGVNGASDEVVELESFTHLAVGPLEGQMILARDFSTTHGMANVNLLQLGMIADPADPAVRLMINENPSSPDAEGSNVTVGADSFTDLARREPELFDEFVRPMLDEVGLAGVLDPDVRAAATQLFFADLPVDEETRTRVRELLPQLDAANYQDRVAAQRALEELGRAGASSLLAIREQGNLSPEQEAAISRILTDYQPIDPAEVKKLAEQPEFLRDVLKLRGGPDDEILRRLARERLEALSATAPATQPAGEP